MAGDQGQKERRRGVVLRVTLSQAHQKFAIVGEIRTKVVINFMEKPNGCGKIRGEGPAGEIETRRSLLHGGEGRIGCGERCRGKE